MKFQCGGGERGSDPSSITLDEHKRTPELIWQWTRTFSPELKGWYIISLYSHFNWPPANLTDLPGIGLPSSYNHRQETSSISWYNIPAVVIASSKWLLHHQCANHRFLNTLGMTLSFSGNGKRSPLAFWLYWNASTGFIHAHQLPQEGRVSVGNESRHFFFLLTYSLLCRYRPCHA